MPRRRVLYLVARAPQARVDGYVVRVRGLLEELARRYELCVGAADAGEAGFPGYEGVTYASFPQRLDLVRAPAPPVRDAFRSFVDGLVKTQEPDVLLLASGTEFAAFGRRDLPPVVADRIDSQTLTLLRSIRRGGGGRGLAGSLSDLPGMARYERRIVRSAAATVAVGEDDARALRRLGGRDTVHVVGNGVRIEAAPAGAGAPHPTVLFSGVLAFGPNIEAARHLARDVWPLVRAALPEAELVIAGRRPAAAVRALAELPGVTVQADVPDLTPLLDAAWVCAAPMRTGSGIKNKVLEAWARGRPVVLSHLAANGLALTPELAPYAVSGAPRLAEALLRLLRDPEERRRVGAASFEVARRLHAWPRVGETLARVLDGVLAAGARR